MESLLVDVVSCWVYLVKHLPNLKKHIYLLKGKSCDHREHFHLQMAKPTVPPALWGSCRPGFFLGRTGGGCLRCFMEHLGLGGAAPAPSPSGFLSCIHGALSFSFSFPLLASWKVGPGGGIPVFPSTPRPSCLKCCLGKVNRIPNCLWLWHRMDTLICLKARSLLPITHLSCVKFPMPALKTLPHAWQIKNYTFS
jgi:hypothetical protein